jgi:Peptidase family C25/Secretion system C-terminal sorting domain
MKKTTFFVLFLIGLCFAQEGARYLIITHDNFYNAIQPLAEWKNIKGMKSKVVRLSEIGSTNTEIKNYILNAYNTWNPRPEFILLVGSAEYLPSFFRNIPYWSYDTDNEYANMTGDFQAELCYGRFPAKTPAQCSVMVAKTLAYERTPLLTDTLWYRSSTVIVNQDGSTDDTTYWNNVRYAATLMTGYGFNRIDTFSNAYGHTATNVQNAVTDGRGIVLYRGEATNNWYTPFSVNPSLTNNGYKLPIICSFTCATMTLAVGESMVGDAWVKAGNTTTYKGAVAFIGNTHSGTNIARVRGAMTIGFFANLFTDSSWHLGPAVLAGKKEIWNEFANQYEYEGFNLEGDPELCIWTAVPKTIEVSYLTAVPMAAQNFNVTVTRQGNPLPNALVCVVKGTEVYAYGYTNSSGQVSLAINPTSLGTMSVTVTARNCLPHEGSAQIVPSSGPYPVYFANIINDPMPGGNGDGNLNPGEVVNLSIGIKNVGSQVSSNVRATLRTTESQVQITDSIQNYGNILPDSILYCTPGFALQVAPACTNQQYLNFTLFIQDSISNYTQNLSLVVEAGKLSYQSNIVSDPIPGGNNNGQLDPGESGMLSLTLLNSGAASFSDVEVKLRSTDQYVTITDSTGHFGRLNQGETKTDNNDPFALSISPQAFSGYRASLKVIEVGLGGTYDCIDSINLVITVGQGGQTAPTGPDGYGYYCYDNNDLGSGQAPTYNWVEINTIGQLITQITNSNDAIDTLILPFTFRYYGQDYTTITASSNGYLVMDNSTYNIAENTPILNACPNLIAPFWDDLDMRQQMQGNGDAYSYSDATNHRYIIEYRQAAHHGNRQSQETFQVILLDPAYYSTPTNDGEIIYQYSVVSNASSNTVGICDQTQIRGLQLLYNGTYETNTATLAPGRAFRFTTVTPQANPAPWLGLYSMSFSDSLGNNNGLVEPGENILINLTVKNLGQASANNVASILRSQDSDATMIDSTADFGSVAPGATANNDQPYQIQVSANPQDSIANFALTLNGDSAYTTELYFSLDLHGVTGILTTSSASPVTSNYLICFPNPFTKSAMIRYALKSSSPNPKLSIYDAMGRLVTNLKSSANDYFIWNGTDFTGKQVAKGLYFITLTDGKNQVVINRKVIRAN